MAKSILITGGSGLLGRKLSEQLLSRGYEVRHLSRSPGSDPRIKTFLWNIEKQEIDPSCINGVDTIVHLAGAGIADKRWTDKRKQLIIESRTLSLKLVLSLLDKQAHEVISLVSASAIGYYSDRGESLLKETSPPASDFLGICCQLWEDAADEASRMGLRLVKLRTGVVLSKSGGALSKMEIPIKLNVGSPLGSGQQWVPWIHELDVVNAYLFAIENLNLSGPYNLSSPEPVRNKDLVKTIAHRLDKTLWAPAVPEFVLKLMLGEMSNTVLGSTKVSPEKIIQGGFVFSFPDLAEALKDIYGK